MNKRKIVVISIVTVIVIIIVIGLALAWNHFNDYSTFFRAYKKIFGCAPSSVRRKSSGL